MTNEERIKEKILTTEYLAELLVVYDNDENMYRTSDGSSFYWKEDAIKDEIEWLRSESDT